MYKIKAISNRLRSAAAIKRLQLRSSLNRLRAAINTTVFINLLYWTRNNTVLTETISKYIKKEVISLVSKSDNTSISSSKITAELTLFVNKLELLSTKASNEALAITETIEFITSFIRQLKETSRKEELVSLDVAVPKQDNKISYDVINLTSDKAALDSTFKEDSTLFTNIKSVPNKNLLVETVSTESQFLREYLEDESSTDTLKLSIEIPNTEVAPKDESYAVQLGNTLDEISSKSDSLTLVAEFNRERIETNATSNSTVVTLDKLKNESLAVNSKAKLSLIKFSTEQAQQLDSGFINCQGYVDPAYFQEAYIGEYREI